MKAAFFRKHGGPEVMEYGDVPDPVAGPGQVLIDVHAASVAALRARALEATLRARDASPE